MPERTLPNLGLKAFFDIGADGWGDEVSRNFLLLSVLAQAGAISTVATTPGSPTNGDVHIFSAAHPTEPNRIAIRDAGAWIFVTPLEGWSIYDRGANALRVFNGTVWENFAGGGVSIGVEDEGAEIISGVSRLNFVGAGVTVTDAGSGEATVTIPGGGGGGGGGGLVLLEEITLTARTSSVIFDSIPATYKDLRITAAARSIAASNVDVFSLRFNNDVSSSYAFSRSNRFGSSISNAASALQLGSVPANNSDANDFGAADFLIPNYANTSRHKALTGTNYASDAGSPLGHFHGGIWRKTAAIDRIDLFAVGGDLETDSVFRLWGMS